MKDINIDIKKIMIGKQNFLFVQRSEARCIFPPWVEITEFISLDLPHGVEIVIKIITGGQEVDTASAV